MAKILLTTLNARYIHSAFGLRYLYANLGEHQKDTQIIEFTIQERAHEIVERILREAPVLVGFSVYIWNVKPITEVVGILKKVAPQITIVVGGPEVSYETELNPLYPIVDYVITGEGDVEFRDFCDNFFAGKLPAKKIIYAALPQPADLKLPYEFYSDEDIKNRVIYVEASRGCPFTCEFCLSSLDIPVRQFDTEKVLAELDKLFQRGVRNFKFVDRTFNLNIRTSQAILDFFWKRYEPGLFIHFEMIPDRFPEALRESVARFPVGAVQFEIGIQTFSTEVSALISRRQDYQKVEDNISYLRENTGVHLHVDLIVGLPGESVESFSQGFDRLVAMGPQEIQVGILKRLRGTPIIRHDLEWKMVYSDQPPYEILSNSLIDYQTMQRFSRFSRYWDLIANSGNFLESVALIWSEGDKPFEQFMRWSDWLYQTTNERHGYSTKRLTEYLFTFLTEVQNRDRQQAGKALVNDYLRNGAIDLPNCLKEFVADRSMKIHKTEKGSANARQLRHVG